MNNSEERHCSCGASLVGRWPSEVTAWALADWEREHRPGAGHRPVEEHVARWVRHRSGPTDPEDN